MTITRPRLSSICKLAKVLWFHSLNLTRCLHVKNRRASRKDIMMAKLMFEVTSFLQAHAA